MGWWQINADTLARSRFIVSPVSETLASLKVLNRGTAAHPITDLLIRAAFGRTWTEDYFTPPPLGNQSFDEELTRIRTMPR